MSDSESDSDFEFNFISNAAEKTQQLLKKAASKNRLQSPNLNIPPNKTVEGSVEKSDEVNVILADGQTNQLKRGTKTSFSPATKKDVEILAIKPSFLKSRKQDAMEEESVSVTPPPSAASSRENSLNNKGGHGSNKTANTLVQLEFDDVLQEPESQKMQEENECMVIGDIPEIIQLQPNLDYYDAHSPLKMDVNVKIRWKHQIVRITTNNYDLLGKLFDNFASKIHENVDNLIFKLNEKILFRTDTYKSLRITIADFITAEYKMDVVDITKDQELIELKLQNIGTNARNASKTMKIRKSDKMEGLMKAYAEQLGVKLSELSFKYEGSLISCTDTPESLELEEDDIIDVHGITLPSKIATPKNKGASKKSKAKKKSTPAVENAEKTPCMVVIDDTMFSDSPNPSHSRAIPNAEGNTGNVPVVRRVSQRFASKK